ncbi:hypothetical protein [Pseudofrankia sp. BMG5.37]|uniref:hypothetical protein n=1 Tax=Pseudofrankia sp. BMG5.37 TaxID=3050035 RepID=UPI0028958287|nr:hypothetical protein [Pseudofrankia sp. BMG5.37]MDT3442892.1 hypothetical protein [Pseudofrankia sp. BMG5.37]
MGAVDRLAAPVWWSATLVSMLAGDLISGEYHLPFRPGGFAAWAAKAGLLT